MEISILGCIGHLMAASRMKELLEVIYTSNGVRHMLTGKTTSQPIRDHMLVDAAQNAMLTAMACNSHLPGTVYLTDNTMSRREQMQPPDHTTARRERQTSHLSIQMTAMGILKKPQVCLTV